MLRCRLCWRIGISIFAAIFLVEAAVLVFSAARFESSQLNEIENRGAESPELNLIVATRVATVKK